MPTGSLCAERNVIGSALSADLSLLRGDIKAVAVLSVPRLGRAPSNNTTFDSNTTPAVSAVAPAGINPNADLGLLARGTTGAGAGGAGRKIWGGNASATNSVPGSSPQSRNLSPLALTPTFDVSPVWSRREEGARSGGVNSAQFRYQGGGVRGMEKEENSDKERLESFRKVGCWDKAGGGGLIALTFCGQKSCCYSARTHTSSPCVRKYRRGTSRRNSLLLFPSVTVHGIILSFAITAFVSLECFVRVFETPPPNQP